MGAWRINKDESDDGRRKLQHAKETQNTNRGNGPYGSSGPRVSGPWPGGYPGGGGGYPRDNSSDYDEMGDIVNPPREMLFRQQMPDDPGVELLDDRDHRRMFYTDGRKLQKNNKGPDYQEIAAKWDGSKLVTDEKGAHNGKISRTYELSEDGKQLIETVHVSDSKGNHPATVQYVYDALDDREFSR